METTCQTMLFGVLEVNPLIWKISRMYSFIQSGTVKAVSVNLTSGFVRGRERSSYVVGIPLVQLSDVWKTDLKRSTVGWVSPNVASGLNSILKTYWSIKFLIILHRVEDPIAEWRLESITWVQKVWGSLDTVDPRAVSLIEISLLKTISISCQ